jgi:hypothetical protein
LPDGVHEKPPDALIDELLRRSRPAEEVAESDELLSQLTARLMARVTQIEVTADLGYESASQ